MNIYPSLTVHERELIDSFASAALNGMLASWYVGNAARLFDGPELACDAYSIAFDMIKERRKTLDPQGGA
jgi:hypothetical protein